MERRYHECECIEKIDVWLQSCGEGSPPVLRSRAWRGTCSRQVKPGTDKFLGRAARCLSSAAEALEGGAADMAAARAYSAMIAAAKALLNEKGLRLTAHAAICAAHEKHAAAAGIAEGQIARLREAYERRERSAREDLATSFEDAREMVERAREFVEAVGARVNA